MELFSACKYFFLIINFTKDYNLVQFLALFTTFMWVGDGCGAPSFLRVLFTLRKEGIPSENLVNGPKNCTKLYTDQKSSAYSSIFWLSIKIGHKKKKKKKNSCKKKKKKKK